MKISDDHRRTLEEIALANEMHLRTILYGRRNAALALDEMDSVDPRRETRRAQLAPSARHDREKTMQHDFRNAVESLVFAVQLEDRDAINACCVDLIARYRDALGCRIR